MICIKVVNMQRNLAHNFNTYKNAMTVENLTEAIQLIFHQELKESRQSFTNLVSNIENLPEDLRQILYPIENVSNELLSGQVNLAGNIQDQKEG